MVCGAEFRAETCATAEKELQLQNNAKFVALARNAGVPCFFYDILVCTMSEIQSHMHLVQVGHLWQIMPSCVALRPPVKEGICSPVNLSRGNFFPRHFAPCGTKPSDVASAPHSHVIACWPNGAQCVHWRRLVRGRRTILYDSLVGTVKESYLLQLSVSLYTFGSRSAGVTK